MPCARPARCVERASSSRSSGPTNVENRSRNSAFAPMTISRRSSCTRVLNTIGRRPWLAAPLMRRTASCALSRLDTNGKVTGRNSCPSNCVMRLWPSVSAVTPVWSETKKTVPPPLAAAVSAELRRMSGDGAPPAVAVRSSATAEDLPEASFAGQQESFLNVSGEAAVLEAMRAVFASLYNDRAIAYRVHQGFAHDAVALSAGVQHMVRSDVGASGVMFTLDTDSGFREVVFITASWGLGETVVQGAVNPDEFYVYKPALRAGKYPILRRNLGGKALKMVYAPQGSAERVRTVAVPPEDQRRFCLSEADLVTLARQALVIEEHY